MAVGMLSIGDLFEANFGVWGMVIANGIAVLTDLSGKEVEFKKTKIPKEAVKITGDRMTKDVYVALKAVAVALSLPVPGNF